MNSQTKRNNKMKMALLTLSVSIAATKVQAQNGLAIATNTLAPVTCSKSVFINAPAQKVFAKMADIDNWATWQTDITHPKASGPVQPNTHFTWKTGGAHIRSVLHTVNGAHALGWTGKTMGLYAIHNWTFSEQNGGTLVRVDESMQGMLASLFKKSFNKNLEHGMLHWLELLKTTCEAQ